MAIGVDKNLGLLAIAASIGAVGLLSYDAYTHVDKAQTSYEFPSLDTRESTSRSRVQDVIAAYLFGEKVAPAAKVVESKPKPVKELNVQIAGLMASSDSKYAMAVLVVDGNKPKSYRVGDTLGDKNIVLKAVDSLKVLVNFYGEEQEVLLKRPELNNAPREDSLGLLTEGSNASSDNIIPDAQITESTTDAILEPIEPPLVDNAQDSFYNEPDHEKTMEESLITEDEIDLLNSGDGYQPVDVSRQDTSNNVPDDQDAPPSPYDDELPANAF